MFNSERFAFIDRSADDFLTFNRLVSPTVAMLDDGTHFAVVHLQGGPLLLREAQARYAERRRVHAVMRGMADRDVMIYEHLVCHHGVAPFGQGDFASPYAAELSQDYHAATDAGLVSRDWFVTVMVKPPATERWFGRNRQADTDQRLIRMVEERCALLIDALPEYGPTRLGVRRKGGVAYSEIAEAMRLILFCRWEPVPVPAGRLSSVIYSDHAICSLSGFELRSAGRRSFGAMFGLREYIETVPPTLLDDLLGSTARFVLTNSYRFLSRGAVTDRLGLREQQMANASDHAGSLITGLSDALDDVASGRALMGDHHLSVALHVDHHHMLDTAASQMRSLLINAGLPVSQEGLGCEAAYWAQAPGAPSWLRARHGAISAHNFISFSSKAGEPRGGGTGHWGRAVMRLRTKTGTAHDFHPHVGDVGHTLLFGPTGSGKTVFLGLFAAMLDRAVARQGGVTVVLDADGSNELTVRACGGSYTQIRRGQPSGMAPLKALHDTPEARSWLLEFTLGLIMADGGPLPRSRAGRRSPGLPARCPLRRRLREVRHPAPQGQRHPLDGDAAAPGHRASPHRAGSGLLDAGTWITGRVNGGLRRGQRRLFAVMTRIETPQGCLIRIRAPAADALGQAGLDGEIDNHFFQRFGAYIGMAFLDAGMQGAVLAASNSVGRSGGSGGNVSFYQFQNAGRQGGRDLFADDLAIPPTLRRNQAEPIVVRLTQDIDMRPCFRLRTREGTR